MRSIELYVRPFNTPEGRDAFMEHLLALDSADTAAVAPRLKEIIAPTAILWGRNDPFLPADLGRRLHEAIGGSTLEVLPTGCHFVPEDAPARVGDMLTALLAR
jgi:pimeloyl-ACP methyl ester carboxylesterase